MTKLLDITNGEYIKLVSSIEYDKLNPNSDTDLVENIEDSYRYIVVDRNVEELIKYLLSGREKELYPYHNYTREMFAIIEDD